MLRGASTGAGVDPFASVGRIVSCALGDVGQRRGLFAPMLKQQLLNLCYKYDFPDIYEVTLPRFSRLPAASTNDWSGVQERLDRGLEFPRFVGVQPMPGTGDLGVTRFGKHLFDRGPVVRAHIV